MEEGKFEEVEEGKFEEVKEGKFEEVKDGVRSRRETEYRLVFFHEEERRC